MAGVAVIKVCHALLLRVCKLRGELMERILEMVLQWSLILIEEVYGLRIQTHLVHQVERFLYLHYPQQFVMENQLLLLLLPVAVIILHLINGMVHQAVLERILYCQPQQRIRIQEQLHLPIGL